MAIADRALANMDRAIKSDATRVVYMHRIGEYKNFVGAKTYTDLLNGKAKQIEDKIISYVDWLQKDKKVVPKTIRLAVSAVRLFYVSNRVALNWEWLRSMLPAVDKVTDDRLYTKDELKLIYNKCDERKRVMFLLLLSSGIRIGALPLLKVKDLERIKEYGLYKISVYSGTKSKYISFCTPEASEAVDYYLEYRRQRGEKVTGESPLIVKQYARSTAKGEEPKVHPITLEGCIAVLDDLIYDAGVRKKGDGRKRKEIMRFHAWRKACNSAMIKAGVHPFVKERILGHTVGLDDSYGRLSDADLLEGYLKAVPELTISDAPELQRQVRELEVKAADIDTMKAAYLKLKADNEQLTVMADKRYLTLEAMERRIIELAGEVRNLKEKKGSQ
jgi:integrase